MGRFFNEQFQRMAGLGLAGCLFLFMACSCSSTKSITYFQRQGLADTVRYSTLAAISPVTPTIQPGDILAVVVSSLSEESNLMFNFSNINPVTTTSFPGSSGGGGREQPLGYLVDPAGAINIPLLGSTKLVGLTLEQAGQLVKERLGQYVKDPTVNVRQLNHKFTVIGEVSRPGVYNLLDNHTTLPEVLGMAGDMTIFGRRDNVMLLRTSNNKREVIKLDLTSRDVLNSPYYYVQNNDVLYVEARAGKFTSTDRTIQILPIFLSIGSTLLVLVSILVR